MKAEDLEELRILEASLTTASVEVPKFEDAWAKTEERVSSVIRQVLKVSDEDARSLAKFAIERFGLEATASATELLRRRKVASLSAACDKLWVAERKKEKHDDRDKA